MWRALLLWGMACGGAVAQDQDEVAQAAGDAMASFDEASQGGAFALWTPGLWQRPMFRPSWPERLGNALLPKADAAACSTVAFTSCSSGVRTRTFGGCDLGTAALDGTVTLTFSEAGCTMGTTGDTVTRTADFTLTGTRNASLQVSSPNGGQRITRNANSFSYTVFGMRRVATGANNNTLFDVSTKTTSDITITGVSRSTRVVNGGTLEVTHNVRDYTVALTPSNVTWSAFCNCPVAGTLTGSVTGSVTGNATVTFTGCGSADITWKGVTESVSLDRCAGL